MDQLGLATLYWIAVCLKSALSDWLGSMATSTEGLINAYEPFGANRLRPPRRGRPFLKGPEMNAETTKRLDNMEQKAFDEMERKIQHGYFSDAAHCSRFLVNIAEYRRLAGDKKRARSTADSAG